MDRIPAVGAQVSLGLHRQDSVLIAGEG